jgi:hypothetical protein
MTRDAQFLNFPVDASAKPPVVFHAGVHPPLYQQVVRILDYTVSAGAPAEPGFPQQNIRSEGQSWLTSPAAYVRRRSYSFFMPSVHNTFHQRSFGFLDHYGVMAGRDYL